MSDVILQGKAYRRTSGSIRHLASLGSDMLPQPSTMCRQYFCAIDEKEQEYLYHQRHNISAGMGS